MSERRLDNERREYPKRRKINVPVGMNRRSGIFRRVTEDRRSGRDRRVFWDQRSPINRRRAKDKRKVSLPVIIESRATRERRNGKDTRVLRRRHK